MEQIAEQNLEDEGEMIDEMIGGVDENNDPPGFGELIRRAKEAKQEQQIDSR